VVWCGVRKWCACLVGLEFVVALLGPLLEEVADAEDLLAAVVVALLLQLLEPAPTHIGDTQVRQR
jgi:hypothetical protein